MSIEESIKLLEEIAEGFEELSSEVCARTDLRAMREGRAKGIRQAIALIKASLKGQSNNPLTPEQLRETDGDPVWIGGNGLNCWDIFIGFSTDGIACFLRAALPMENCGEDWIPYRRKPEEVET